MAKSYLSQANKLYPELAAIIALPGMPVKTAISVYADFTDVQKEHALQRSSDLLETALELQDAIRRNQYICDGYKNSTFKVSLRYLNIDEDEVIKDDELLIILENAISTEEEELFEEFGW